MLPRNESLCNTCNKLEDEIHFLIECDKYKYERVEKFKTITVEVPNFNQISESLQLALDTNKRLVEEKDNLISNQKDIIASLK